MTVSAIAVNTFKEAVRNRVFYLLVFVGIFFALSSAESASKSAISSGVKSSSLRKLLPFRFMSFASCRCILG